MILGRYYIKEDTDELYSLDFVSGDELSMYRNVALLDFTTGEPYGGYVQVHTSVNKLEPIEAEIVTNGDKFQLSDYEPDY